MKPFLLLLLLSLLVSCSASQETRSVYSLPERPFQLEEKKPMFVVEESSLAFEPFSPFLICIDPGHQQRANLEHEPIGPGSSETKPKVAAGTTGIVTKKPEYILTLEASLLLKEALEARGMNVIMTRTAHDVNISNHERAALQTKQKQTSAAIAH